MQIGKKCLVSGCSKVSVSKGLCDTHRKRAERHGTIEQTRPVDWGAREKHLLYNRWCWLKRKHSANLGEWVDFWAFVKGVGEAKDSRFAIARHNEQAPFGNGNWYWRKRDTSPKNPEAKRAKHAKYAKAWREANRDKAKSSCLQKLYRITLDDYNQLLTLQKHVCAICKQPETNMQATGTKFSLAVDHCHTTGKVRGLLCSSCNRAIGLFNHSSDTILSAVKYLKENA